VAAGPALIIQVARGGAVDRQLGIERPDTVVSGEAVVEAGPADEAGALVPSDHGEVVLSVLSPEALAREPEVVEAAEEVRDEELAPVVEAAKANPRPVILRIIRDA